MNGLRAILASDFVRMALKGDEMEAKRDDDGKIAAVKQTRRDWLAGLAMQGMAAGPYWCENFTADKPEFLSAVAVAAYAMADAIISEGKK